MKALKLALLVPGLLLLFAGTLAAGFYLAGSTDEPLDEARQYFAALTAEEKPEESPAFIEIAPMTVNLRPTAHGKFIQLALTLKTTSGHRQQAEVIVPDFVDILHDYLRGLDEQSIQGTDGVRRLRQDLQQRLAAVDPQHAVEGVLIRRMVVQ